MTRMSRAHFILIADTIKHLPSFEAYNKENNMTAKDVVRFDVICSCFADALRSTNPMFKRERFIDACNNR
jgi:hypothetical protein